MAIIQDRYALLLTAVVCIINTTIAFDEPVGHFFRALQDGQHVTSTLLTASSAQRRKALTTLENVTHYRLLPGSFPDDMPFHFDGLATTMAFRFTSDGSMTQTIKHYQSELQQHYDRCIFLGTGTGPTLGRELCTKNPAVNLLPIEGQLWLTIDTAAWGRVSPDTLETVPNATVDVPSLVLNAHPVSVKTLTCHCW